MAQAHPQSAAQHDPEVYRARLDAERYLGELRRSMNAFHAARILTKQAQTGMIPCHHPPEQIAQYVASMRDGATEERAVKELRDLLTYINQRDPTAAEMEAGPPDSLGVFWAAPVALAAIAGGAWTLSGLFSYLAERERRLQEAVGIQPPSVARSVGRVAIPVALVTAIAGGGIWWWRSRAKSKSKAKTKVSTRAKTKVMQRSEAPPSLPPAQLEDDLEEEDEE